MSGDDVRFVDELVDMIHCNMMEEKFFFLFLFFFFLMERSRYLLRPACAPNKPRCANNSTIISNFMADFFGTQFGAGVPRLM